MKGKAIRADHIPNWAKGAAGGIQKYIRRQDNRKLRRHSKNALHRYENDRGDYNDFLIGGNDRD
jgi:hypothetical protein